MSACRAVKANSQSMRNFARLMTPATEPCRPRIKLDPDNVKNGLGQLVLTVVELVRQLLERQAIRRMEGGSLSEAEVEKLGVTFMRLSDEIDRLKGEFGLEDEDLNLDLGPLGKLL